MDKMIGKRSVQFEVPPCIIGAASVAGEKEGAGKFGKYYDIIEDDPLFGGKTWEEAESKMQHMAADIAIRNAGLESEDIRYIVAGDLLGAADRDFVWHHESEYTDVWCLWCVLDDGRVDGNRFHACGRRICRVHCRHDVESFCQRGKAVSFSFGVRKPATVFGDMDGDRKRRSCDRKGRRKMET